jgi:putative membrane protein insertion efficiency factor
MNTTANRAWTGKIRSLPLAGAKLLIRAYQLTVSPILGPRCRYYPSCSNYALEALDTHGLGRGLQLAVSRILRCHPMSAGGLDPVPTQTSIRKK